MPRTVSVQMPDGTILDVDGVPDGTSDAQVSARVKLPLYTEDIAKGAVSGPAIGMESVVGFLPRAAVGTAYNIMDFLGAKPETKQKLKAFADKYIEGPLDTTKKLFGGDYTAQTAPGRFAQAATAGATGALPSGGTTAALGAASGLGAQATAEAGMGETPQIIVALAPFLGRAGYNLAFPNIANTEIQRALKGTDPAVVTAAAQRMRNASVPVLPGQAFGRDHPMVGLQETVSRSAEGGPRLQQALRDQTAAVEAAPKPWQPFYDAAAGAPLAPIDVQVVVKDLRQRQQDMQLAAKTSPSRAFDQTVEAIQKQGTATVPAVTRRQVVKGQGLQDVVVSPAQTVSTPIGTFGQLQSVRSQARKGFEGLEGVDEATRASIIEALNEALHKNPNMKAADALYASTAPDLAAVGLGRGGLGRFAGSVGSDATEVSTPILRGVGANPALALIPAVRELRSGKAYRELSEILSDPSAEKLIEAAKYSPKKDALLDALRAAIQAKVSTEAGQ